MSIYIRHPNDNESGSTPHINDNVDTSLLKLYFIEENMQLNKLNNKEVNKAFSAKFRRQWS